MKCGETGYRRCVSCATWFRWYRKQTEIYVYMDTVVDEDTDSEDISFPPEPCSTGYTDTLDIQTRTDY